MVWFIAFFCLLVGGVIGWLLSDRRTATLRAEVQVSAKRLADQQKLLDQTDVKLREAFASLSSEALAKNNEAFLNLAREKFTTLSTEAAGNLDERKAQIEGLLKPMHEILHQYQQRLTEMEQSRTKAYGDLRQMLGEVSNTQQQLATETLQLATALRRPQTRGQWGEMTLRRLVEMAGMSHHCDFTEQVTVENEQGRQRPDMIVNLPGDRQIVIDCKAVLDAYLDASATSDDTLRRTHLKRHANNVRARSSELSAKSYYNQFKNSPEFVIMFLPGEAFLYAAVEQDGGLIEDCMENGVILATPTTLLALLKAVGYGWRQEQITQNAEEIRQLGTMLYDRVAKVANDFTKLGGSIELAVKSYNEMLGSLESRVMVTARKIGELGARSDKELPELEPIDRQVRELSESTKSLFEG